MCFLQGLTTITGAIDITPVTKWCIPQTIIEDCAGIVSQILTPVHTRITDPCASKAIFFISHWTMMSELFWRHLAPAWIILLCNHIAIFPTFPWNTFFLDDVRCIFGKIGPPHRLSKHPNPIPLSTIALEIVVCFQISWLVAPILRWGDCVGRLVLGIRKR